MRRLLKSAGGWLWVLAFLALPNCVFQVPGFPPPNLAKGDNDWSSAMFCDVQDRSVARHCASADEKATGIRMAEAAIALTQERTSTIGLDFSPAALGRCGGEPEAVVFKCAFPEGCHECLNCGAVMPSPYPRVDDACLADCLDLNGTSYGENPPRPEVLAYCTAEHAHHATNASECFAGSCSASGSLNADFADPRRLPEPVAWTNLVGVAAGGPDTSTLTRTAAAGPDAGASSLQTIAQGDGYVEFTITELGTVRVLGLSTGAADTDPSNNDIGFGIRLSAQNNLGIFENGTRVPDGANPDWGPFVSGDRVRITVRDRFDSTADILYSHISASCSGPKCVGNVFGPDPPHVGSYPFRVDAFIRDQNATLTDVHVVRIK